VNVAWCLVYLATLGLFSWRVTTVADGSPIKEIQANIQGGIKIRTSTYSQILRVREASRANGFFSNYSAKELIMQVQRKGTVQSAERVRTSGTALKQQNDGWHPRRTHNEQPSETSHGTRPRRSNSTTSVQDSSSDDVLLTIILVGFLAGFGILVLVLLLCIFMGLRNPQQCTNTNPIDVEASSTKGANNVDDGTTGHGGIYLEDAMSVTKDKCGVQPEPQEATLCEGPCALQPVFTPERSPGASNITIAPATPTMDTKAVKTPGSPRMEAAHDSPEDSLLVAPNDNADDAPSQPQPGLVNGTASPSPQGTAPEQDARGQAVMDKMLHTHNDVMELVASKGKAPGWKNTGKVGACEAFQNTSMGDGVVGVMGRGRVKASRNKILEVLTNSPEKVNQRQTIEVMDSVPNVEQGDAVPNVPEGIRYLWTFIQLPLITNRDFSVASWARSDENSADDPDLRDWIVSSVSVDVPDIIPSEARKKYIRGEVLMSGWHIKPLPATPAASESEVLSPKTPSAPSSEESCGVTFVSISKMHGTIPSALYKLGSKEGGDLVKALKKAVE